MSFYRTDGRAISWNNHGAAARTTWKAWALRNWMVDLKLSGVSI
jgi:hypothetical protein